MSKIIKILFLMIFVAQFQYADLLAAENKYSIKVIEKGKNYKLLRYDGINNRVRIYLFELKKKSRKVYVENFLEPVDYKKIYEISKPLLIINGGYYSIERKRYYPLGLVKGIGGKISRRSRRWPFLHIRKNGEMKISSYSVEKILDEENIYILQSKPKLIYNGKISTRTKNPRITRRVRKARSGIGVDESKIFFVVVEGNSYNSHGMSLLEFANFLKRIGSREAINLDGGGSSIMVFKGKMLNIPSGGLHPFSFWGSSRPLLNYIGVK